MEVHTPTGFEIDRKRLLRHTVCFFLLHLVASQASPCDTTPSCSSPTPSSSSLLAHPDLPYHIIHSESLFTFASSSFDFLSFPFFFSFLISDWLLCAYYRVLYGHRCQWNVEISPVHTVPFLCLDCNLNGSRVLTTCRASSWLEFMVPYSSEKIGTAVFNVGLRQWRALRPRMRGLFLLRYSLLSYDLSHKGRQ